MKFIIPKTTLITSIKVSINQFNEAFSIKEGF